jgi:hypothetical protein
MNKKINAILIITLSFLVLFGCKKPDVFNTKLPTGRVNGKVVFESNGQPAKGIVVVIKNTVNGAFHLVITDNDGKYTVGRLSTGNYSLVPTNDSLYSPVDVFADVTDGNETTVADIKIKLTDLPILTLNLTGVLDVTRNTMTLKTLVNDGRSTVLTRGYTYLRSNDARDVTLFGIRKTHVITEPFDLTQFQTTMTGLTANAEYKIRAYAIVPRGGIDNNGVQRTVTIYSASTILVKTLP